MNLRSLYDPPVIIATAALLDVGMESTDTEDVSTSLVCVVSNIAQADPSEPQYPVFQLLLLSL